MVQDIESCGATALDHCPHCGCEGFRSRHDDGEYIAICGTRWITDDSEPGGVRVLVEAAACYVIEHKNDLILERDIRIRELEAALSERHLTLIPGGAA